MIKLSIEIKEEKFSYSYEVGKDERHSSESPLSADALVAFNELLRICSNVNKWRRQEFERELWGKAYIEKMEKDKK